MVEVNHAFTVGRCALAVNGIAMSENAQECPARVGEAEAGRWRKIIAGVDNFS